MSAACCRPAPFGGSHNSGADRQRAPRPAAAAAGPRSTHVIGQASVPAGRFVMGDSGGDRNPADGEVPLHEVRLNAFEIDVTTVTNDDFSRFVLDTGYCTEAEEFGFSAVFHLAVAAPPEDIMGPAAGTPWWLGVRGANWRHPDGPRSDVEGRENHPVVHVSWHDAQAYCRWAGRRLPSEAEWERASRGGLEGTRYPWGNDLLAPDGSWRCNISQGRFPTVNTADDGWLTTAPVRSYEPNGLGLWQTVGNVWEWCADAFDPHIYASRADGTTTPDPQGPREGDLRVLRGGSYLCHASYCNRYRNSARSSNTPDSSMGNASFRTVAA